jgi:PAS domain S-box-containing protein
MNIDPGAGSTTALKSITPALLMAAGFVGMGFWVAETPSFWPFKTTVLYAGLASALLCLGLLWTCSKGGLPALLASERAGGAMARRLLPAAVAVPVMLGWLRLAGEHAGLYGKDCGIVLFTAALIAAFGVVVYRNAAALERADIQRQQAEEQTANELRRLSALREEAEEAKRCLENDIAMRMETEMRLRESEERFRAVAETAIDAVVSCDQRGNLIFFNRSAERIFGYRAVEVLGKPLSLLVPECSHSMSPKGFVLHLATGENGLIGKTVEMAGRRKQGLQFPVELSLSTWKAGHERFFTAFIRDITKRKLGEERIRQLNEDLKAQTARLEAANKELEAFSYSVSHDLRAPLRGIDGFSKILAEEYASRLDPEGQRILRSIRSNTRQMGKLIDDLLAFSRLTRVEFEKSPVNMAALAQSAVDALIKEQNGRSVEVVVHPLIPAAANTSLILQVFLNLISNAFKFARNRPHPRVEIGCEIGEGENIYYVRDNGVGFDMDYADKLFGVFQRLHSASEFEGTGVGLAIVKRIVSRHGGRVWADSKVNEEATFYFTLPIESEPSWRMQA